MADSSRGSIGDVPDFDVEADDETSRPEEPDLDIQDFLDLPPEVRRRVRALKKIQLDFTKIEAKFFEEMHALESKYMPLYTPLFEQRKLITTGEYEPTEVDCEFGSDGESEFDSNDALVRKVETALTTKDAENNSEKKVAGIPNFWLKIFHHVDMLSELMETYDEPIVAHLQDIKVEMTNQPMGFKLYFHFGKNEYFTNEVLTKVYEMKCEVDPEDPFSFEGPEIVKCTGCTIDWNKGKNVTVKTIRKKEKHKQRGSIRTVSKQVTAPSFFNFFSPPVIPDEPEAEMDEEVQMRLTSDFEVGQYIRERIVPRAVLFFTGEALDDDFEEEEEDEENEDEEEEEDEEAEAPGKRGGRKQAKAQKNSQECKQQ